MDSYDAVIIGAGPAGITASIYASRKRMSSILLTGDIGGQTLWSGSIENYTGWQMVSGPELVKKFEEHLAQFDISVRESEEVVKISRAGAGFRTVTGKSEYESRTVIISSGKKSRELGVPGEKEFRNRGVQYCATCDAPLFSGMDVAVAGGGNSALDAALQLAKIAKSVLVINNERAVRGDAVMLEKIERAGNARVLNGARIVKINGDAMVSGVEVEKDGESELMPVQGVFVEIGLIPNSNFVEFAKKNEKGEIIVDCFNRTSCPGAFAAGDVTNVPEKQIIIAAGEGAKAALAAYRHIIGRES